MSDTLLAGILFLVTYGAIVAFRHYKSQILWAGIAVGILFGYLHSHDIVQFINWNVMGIFAGTLILSEYFVLSHVPDAISTVLIGRTRTVGMAYLVVCIFASLLSICIENVAAVLIMAPIMIGLAKRIGVSPVPGIIGIAIASNLQGAATLIGDPPSMILASYMNMNFNDFFLYHGKPGMFFAVQVGAVGSMLFLYWLFRRYKNRVTYEGEVKIRSLVPTACLIVMIVGLTLSSLVDREFKWFGGALCMALAALCILLSRFARVEEHRRLAVHFDFGTTAFLAGVFVIVVMLEHKGVIAATASFLSAHIPHDPFVAFIVIVWVSIAFSAFIDNVPYLTAMIPVVQLLSDSLGVGMPLLVFGLLIGASLGGNITPIGAAANIVAVGSLKKHNIHVSFSEFARVGLPFTVIATLLGSMFVYFVWR